MWLGVAFKSSLKNCYETAEVEMEKSTDSWLNHFVNGYKKEVAEKKSRGIMPITEGKSPLTFEGYAALAQYLMNLHRKLNLNASSGHDWLRQNLAATHPLWNSRLFQLRLENAVNGVFNIASVGELAWQVDYTMREF